MRKITKIIWHCSATPAGRSHNVADIRRWHRERKMKDVGYHFVVLLDGRVETGRPLERMGAHTPRNNAHSIGICYIGGVVPDPATGKWNPKDTRTPAQIDALYDLTRRLLERFPLATVHGHNEFSAKACPSFDVRQDWADEVARIEKYKAGL
jgi:N-acetylmuramoyl-L-alanine amidase